MSIEANISLYQEQKKSKPQIENVISEYLDGEMKNIALDFVARLRTNRMSPIWASGNSWKSSYKGKGICYVKLDRGKWVVIPLLDHLNQYREIVVNEGLQNTIWVNIFRCEECNPGCAPGKDRTVLDRVFKNSCYGRPPIVFNDPNEAAIDCIKRLLEMERRARSKKNEASFEHFRFYNEAIF